MASAPNGELNGNGPWYVTQLRMIVNTIGVSGVILAIVLYGGYKLTSSIVAAVQPSVVKVTQEHVEFMRQVAATTTQQVARIEKQNEILQQQVEITGELVKLLQSNSESLALAHKRLDEIQRRINGEPFHGEPHRP